MKSMIALPLLWILACSVFAQGPTLEANTVTEPEFGDVFFGLAANGQLVALERQTAVLKGKASGFIVMSMKSVSEFPGAKSTVRFPANTRLEFVVRSAFASSSVDPSTMYALRKLESKKKSRELVMMSGHATPLGASTTTSLAEGVLPVEFSKYGAASIKMTTAPLVPGEYAVSRQYAQAVFCFGVD